jgi:hypothetical protein
MKKLLLTLAILTGSLFPAITHAQVPVSAGGTGLTSVPAGECLKGLNNLRLTSGPCGTGGSGGGSWSTTTSGVAGQEINYSNNNDDIIVIGSNSTTTAEFYFDPNTNTFMQSALTGSTTFQGTTTLRQAVFNGGPWVDARTCGAKGDGTTDDSAAINTCISDLSKPLELRGGTVYLSAGSRSAATKYKICTGPITMRPFVDVIVQKGVEIEVCNGYASSTVQFISTDIGTYYANWKGGIFKEAGTPKKLWYAFHMASQSATGGVFWNRVEDAVVYFPDTCIKNTIVGSNNGWLNSNTYKDIVCFGATHMADHDDGGSQGLYGISSTKYDNVQLQATVATETCFTDIMHNWTTIENARCYDMNATSTSLTIDSKAIGTNIIGGAATERSFTNNGNRTLIMGDATYPFYASSTGNSVFVNHTGKLLLGATSTAWSNEALNIANGAINLGQSNSNFNSPIYFYRSGAGEWQQEYIKAATTSAGSPNSGDIGISARQNVIFNIDSDSNVTSAKFIIRNNRSDVGIAAGSELFSVDEVGRATYAYASTTALSATTLCLTGDSCITSWPVGGGTNYLTNSGSNTYLNLGSNLQAPTFQATGTAASIFPYASTTALTGDVLYAGTGASTLGADSNLVKPGSGNAFLNIKGGQGKAKISLGNTGITFMTGDAFSPDYDFRIGATSGTNTGASIFKLYGTGGMAFGSSFASTDPGSGRMIIQNSLGIGTTSAHQALTINGNAYIAGFITATSTTQASSFVYASTTMISAGGVNISPYTYSSFTYATSTWTGTTTIPMEVGYGEKWNSVRCFTNAGTVNVDFYHGSSHLNLLNASTTVGLFGFTTNNTIADASKVQVDIGTPASSPTKITCTIKKQQDYNN